jgi:cell division transport system permease protein
MRSFRRITSEIWRAVKFELPSTLGSLLTILLATILPGIFWISYKNMTQTEARFKNNMTMNVFLRNEPTKVEISRLENEFDKLKGVRAAEYISKNEAFSKMKQRFGAEMLEGMEDDNPLPASFVLRVDQSVFLPGAADALARKLKSFPEVDDVVFAGDMLTRLGRIVRAVEVIGLAFSILVAFAAVFIVANTVRVAISHRKKTIEIMELVGATRGYILTPFVLLGGILGLLGAALSITALSYLVNYVSAHFFAVDFLKPNEVLAFLLAGLLLGMVGALRAAERHLNI